MPASFKSGVLILILIFLVTPALADNTSTPEGVVEKLHQSLLGAMKEADKLAFRGRYDLIGPVVNESFDFKTIVRIVTGRHWKTTSEDQRARFLTTFAELSTATYAANFSGFAGERFATLGTDLAKGGTIVRTELIKADGSKVPLTYMLRKTDGGWRIVNVVAQGVSDLSLKRAEYAVVIESEGIEALTKRLNDKIAEMGRNS
jgi:phospholipid transport system substrate-binding protein